MSKKLRLVFFLLILNLPLINCANEKEEKEEVIRSVKYVEIVSSNSNKTRKFPGVAKAGIEFDLSFKVSGTISKLPIKVGNKLKKGELVASLDPKDYILQKQEIEASLLSSLATARNADADYARTKSLYENNNISKGELDSSRASSESANAQVRAQRKRLEFANLQYSYTELNSPDECLVAEVPVEVNENISIGETITKLSCESNPEVKIEVPESIISKIERDSNVVVQFDAVTNKRYSGYVSEVGVASNSASTTFPVTITIDETDNNIFPGMAAEVTFNFTDVNQIYFIVPMISIIEDKDGKYIYKLELDEKDNNGQPVAVVKRVNVKIGEVFPDGIEIIEGVKEGDLIVTAGVRRIKEGLKVKLFNE